MSELKTAIVFGCGGVGEKTKEILEKRGIQILFFSDNDEKKWGTKIKNVLVIAPEKISEKRSDFVAIGNYKAAETIKQQLLSMGIQSEKIIVPIEPPRIFPNPIKETGELGVLPIEEYESISTKNYEMLQINIDDSVFINHLDELKSKLEENGIPRYKVCIVSGAVLQAYGLRKSQKYDDIDIIMTSDLREVYGKDLVIVSEHVEMHRQNAEVINDDEIILNTKNHFVFYDLKFMNLDLLYKKRKNTNKKQIEEVKLIENFYNKER